jgi:hypothetical protein
LAGCEHAGGKKVEAVCVALKSAGIEVFPFRGSIREYIISDKKDLRSDARLQADQLRFEAVLSCVDKGTSRQDVQGLRPRLLLGASTLDMKARTNAYQRWHGAACLACHNPSERHGDRLRALERQLRHLSTEKRLEFCNSVGLNADEVDAYLRGAECGSLGETALRDFASRSPTMFSVGFVSLGAAVLLSAAMFRYMLFGDHAPNRLDMTTLNYLNGGLLDAGLAADPECEQQCQLRAKSS